jgi:hypothetical protein
MKLQGRVPCHIGNPMKKLVLDVTGCYFLKWKELHITNMKVNNILENIVLLEKIELKAIHI